MKAKIQLWIESSATASLNFGSFACSLLCDAILWLVVLMRVLALSLTPKQYLHPPVLSSKITYETHYVVSREVWISLYAYPMGKHKTHSFARTWVDV